MLGVGAPLHGLWPSILSFRVMLLSWTQPLLKGLKMCLALGGVWFKALNP